MRAVKNETFTKKTVGHCKCSTQPVIVRFENSSLCAFVWKHRYTFVDDTEKRVNIFRCAKCKEVIHDSFVTNVVQSYNIVNG